MSDVFISYSRADAGFVGKLHTALAQLKREAWVDWEDIPLTAEWLREIYSGIEAADNFVFIISPESVASPTCLKEIEHAATNNKRLIPVLHRTVAANLVPETIGRINFVFLRESDDFDSNFRALIEALDADLDWKRAHTRLTVRAREWERERQDRSFLLRGKDLGEAEVWQSRATTKEPKPTEVHSRYILQSRRAEASRQRLTLGAVVCALVITAGLAVAALLQRNTARQQAAIAQGRQFAAESASVLNQKQDLALLLSVEAENTNDSFEARSALFSALQHQPNLHAFLRAGRSPALGAKPVRRSGLAFSPNGKMIAAVGGMEDNTVVVWDAATHRPIGAPLEGHTAPVRSVAFSPDSRTLLSGGEDNALIFWSTETWRPLARGTGHAGGISSVAFSPDGKVVASGDANNTILLWDAETRKSVAQLRSSNTRSVFWLTFLSDGTLAATGVTAEGHEITEFWDLAARHPKGGPIERRVMGYSPTGRVAAVATDAKTVGALDLESRKVFQALPGSFDAFTGVAVFSPDNRVLAVANGNDVELWENPPTRLGTLKAHQDYVEAIAFSPDGKTLASLGWDEAVLLWDAAAGHPLGKQLAGSEGGLLAFSNDGRTLASTKENEVILWDLPSGKRIKTAPAKFSPMIGSLAFSPDGATLVLAGLSPQEEAIAQLLDLRSASSQEAPEFLREATAATLDSSGATLAAGLKDGRIVVWDLRKRQTRWESYAPTPNAGAATVKGKKTWEPTPLTAVTALAFSPNGKLLVSGHADGTIGFWDADSGSLFGSRLPAFDSSSQFPLTLSFTNDGGTLVTTAHEMISLWDAPTRRRVNFFGTGSGIGAPLIAAFSPDATLLAWGAVFSATPDVKLLDSRARQTFGPPLRYWKATSDESLSGLAFSPDGKMLAASYQRLIKSSSTWIDDGIVLWNFDLASWKRWACALANRNLTLEEWDQYVAGLPYHRTCADLP